MEHKWREEGEKDSKVQNGSKEQTGREKQIPLGAIFSAPLQTGLGTPQPPVQWVPGHSRG
jgi:hypothetical protein